MKTNLKKETLATAILFTFYAAYYFISRLYSWTGVPLFVHHPIKGAIIGSTVNIVLDLCIAFLFFAIWTNRNKLPQTDKSWRSYAFIVVCTLAYKLIYQMQMILSYPLHCSNIFIYTLWICPFLQATALWIYYAQIKTKEDNMVYSLNKTRSWLILSIAILLLTCAVVSLILMIIWYNNPTEWLVRWYWRIPMIITALSEILLILFLTLKNK
ncbi:MAG: hypothetical protein IJS05_04495 [Paludibacteraceae bacterium]|nr:hypothetical protein [Paludibacteraceae bacterium]